MRKLLKGALKSKTMWFSAGLVLLGAIGDVSAYLQGVLTPQMFNWVMVVVGLVSAILRILTTKPLDEK